VTATEATLRHHDTTQTTNDKTTFGTPTSTSFAPPMSSTLAPGQPFPDTDESFNGDEEDVANNTINETALVIFGYTSPLLAAE
jgi:hypothetical protein